MVLRGEETWSRTHSLSLMPTETRRPFHRAGQRKSSCSQSIRHLKRILTIWLQRPHNPHNVHWRNLHSAQERPKVERLALAIHRQVQRLHHLDRQQRRPTHQPGGHLATPRLRLVSHQAGFASLQHIDHRRPRYPQLLVSRLHQGPEPQLRRPTGKKLVEGDS